MTARRGTATFDFDEALLVGEGAEGLAAYGLRQVVQSSSGSAASAASPDITTYAMAQLKTPQLEVVPGVMLEATVEDMQGRFNLNWLVLPASGPNAGQPDTAAIAAFNHLLELVGIEPKWADLIVDWIDAGTDPLPDGAEDSAYLGQNPPYLTANQYITSTSELLALPGFGHDRFAKLAPYIAALPPATSLNICTAPDKVLDAFMIGKTEYSSDGGTALQQQRQNSSTCFPTLAAYGQSFDPKDFAAESSRFRTSSNYFRLDSLVTIGTTEFNLYSLLFMDGQGPLIHPIQRSFAAD